MTVIHEFQQVLWVTTPLGDGMAILHIDYGPSHNGTLLVCLEDGQLKYFDTNQVRSCRNDTFGIIPRKRVIANRNIGILCLIGKKGTIQEEAQAQYSVLFDGDDKPTLVPKEAVDLIQ
jgi:hypothetical protein